MRARYASTVACGHHVNTGDLIIKVADRQYVCGTCAGLVPTIQPEWSADRLLEDPKIRALLCRALATDNEHEAQAALAAARRLHRKTPGPVAAAFAGRTGEQQQ